MRKNLNVANLITIFRIILIPIFMVLYLNKSFYYNGFPLWAILIYLLAFFSDILDGYIARSTNNITALGKVLDPLADKLLRLCVLCAFMINNVLPLYLFIILLVLDFGSIITGSILYFKRIVIQANIVGKLTTVFMSLALFSCFLHNIIAPVDLILVIIALVLVLITIIQYVVKFFKLYNNVSKTINNENNQIS